MWNEFKNIKSGEKELKEFGLLIGGILLAIALIALWKGKVRPWFFGVGGLLAGLGLFAPALLKPLQKLWMALGLTLGFFVSRIVLTLLFYLVVTPIGMITRAMGKDILDEKIDKSKASYWLARSLTSKDQRSYENQF